MYLTRLTRMYVNGKVPVFVAEIAPKNLRGFLTNTCEAVNCYSRANNIKPDDPIILRNRCAVYLRISQFLKHRPSSASERRPLSGLDPTIHAGATSDECCHFNLEGMPGVGKRTMIWAFLCEAFGADKILAREECKQFDLKDDDENLSVKGHKRTAPTERGRASGSTAKRGRKSDNTSSSSIQKIPVSNDDEDDMPNRMPESQPRVTRNYGALRR